MDLLIHSPLPCVYAGEMKGALHVPALPDSALFLYLFDGAAALDTQPGTLACPAGSYLCFRGEAEAELTLDARRFVLLRASLPSDVPFPASSGVYTDECAEPVFVSIEALSRASDDASLLSLQSEISALFALHLTLALPDNADKARIRPGVMLLKKDFLANDPISRYADACGMHENRFRALFMKVYGCSPIDYRNRLRLTRAQRMIRTLGLPIGAAAAAAGFNSASYFCRQYKKVFGVNPAAGGEDDGQNG